MHGTLSEVMIKEVCLHSRTANLEMCTYRTFFIRLLYNEQVNVGIVMLLVCRLCASGFPEGGFFVSSVGKIRRFIAPLFMLLTNYAK